MSRGLARLSTERRREIASAGGRAAHARGTARKWSVEDAGAAGKLGGEKVAADREHMRRIGALGGKRKAELAAKSNPEKPPAQPAKKREPRCAKPAATPRPEVDGAARPLQALVKGCALAEAASGAGYQPPRPSNSSSPEDRGVQLDRSGSLAGAPGDRTTLSKEPDTKPRTAAERVEEAARARAAQRQRLIERGTAWHERAAAHVLAQRKQAAHVKEEGHPSCDTYRHETPCDPPMPRAPVAACTFPRSQP